jgi:high affinity sulfate transporter 1
MLLPQEFSWKKHFTKYKLHVCNLQLILANPGPAVIQKLRFAKFIELIGEDKIFMSVGDAVNKFALDSAENV